MPPGNPGFFLYICSLKAKAEITLKTFSKLLISDIYLIQMCGFKMFEFSLLTLSKDILHWFFSLAICSETVSYWRHQHSERRQKKLCIAAQVMWEIETRITEKCKCPKKHFPGKANEISSLQMQYTNMIDGSIRVIRAQKNKATQNSPLRF